MALHLNGAPLESKNAAMVEVRGVELAVTDEGSGPAYFWGHGLSGSMGQDAKFSMFNWARLAESHRVVRWDARGHGESTGTEEPDTLPVGQPGAGPAGAGRRAGRGSVRGRRCVDGCSYRTARGRARA